MRIQQTLRSKILWQIVWHMVNKTTFLNNCYLTYLGKFGVSKRCEHTIHYQKKLSLSQLGQNKNARTQNANKLAHIFFNI